MSKNELVSAVVEGLLALRSGRRLRRTTASYAPPPKYSAAAIATIRRGRLRASQALFARCLGVSASTVRAWEQRQRRPLLLARRLLQVAAERSEMLRELAEAR